MSEVACRYHQATATGAVTWAPLASIPTLLLPEADLKSSSAALEAWKMIPAAASRLGSHRGECTVWYLQTYDLLVTLCNSRPSAATLHNSTCHTKH